MKTYPQERILSFWGKMYGMRGSELRQRVDEVWRLLACKSGKKAM